MLKVFQVTHQSHLVHVTVCHIVIGFETTAIDADMIRRDGSEKHLGP